MTEEEIKQATCLVTDSSESGTGWLITPNLVFTALHCISKTDAEVTLRFGAGDSAIEQTATIESFDDDLDICLLRLPKASDCPPIPISCAPLRPGEPWFAFGYPAVKLDLGHVLLGSVEQVLKERVHGVDLDLSVKPGSDLSNYRGLSGAALMHGTCCHGMLRVTIDNSIGAVSLKAIESYLYANGLLTEEIVTPDATPPLAPRPDFDMLFETSVLNKEGGYILLDGAHGIGKSTYCRNFSPQSSNIEVVGAYSFSEEKRGSTPAYQVLPEIFFDWISSLLSFQSTGKPARLIDYSYANLIEATNKVFQSFADRCVQAGKVGVLFIDGINEAANTANDGLKRFLGLLPPTLPNGLVIVITGVGLGALADKLRGIFAGANTLILPALEQSAQQEFCYATLKEEFASPKLVASLCTLAKGHPLYLRYLVDFVNGGANEEDIAAIPAFSGSIEDYYETIWSQLLPDSDAINLLGIIARLRWGIQMSDLIPMLTKSEHAELIPTLSKIRHLLSSPEKAEVYHSSFSNFIIHKTLLLNEWVHGRLVDFCMISSSGDYGTLNKIYHGLRGGPQRETHALEECHQQWIDQAVMLGADPDILLTDIEDSLEASTFRGTAVDIIRLLLLSQRLIFRYDTLFAQSAGLVAQALVALGKAEQALNHIMRYEHLIVDPTDAFIIARTLIQANKLTEAFMILEAIDLKLVTALSRTEQSLNELIIAASLRLHEFALVHFAGGDAPSSKFFRYIGESILFNPQNSLSQKEQQFALQALLGNMLGSELCLEGKYKSIFQLNLPTEANSHQMLLCLLSALRYAEAHARIYGVRLPKEKTDLLLSDIASMLDASFPSENRHFHIIDLLIMAGASPELIEGYADGVSLNAENISLYTESKALPDESAFDSSFRRLRASYFLGEQRIQPMPQAATQNTWENDIESLARAVAWCDGIARRAKASNDHEKLEEIKDYLKNNLLPRLVFPLASRIHWDESYSIPENILPPLYERLTSMCLDCLPEEVVTILNAIQLGFDTQLGLYNEGFRRTLQTVIGLCLDANISKPVADMLFELLCRWRDYVQNEVLNRYELVPELLSMVPMFERMESVDEARNTYQAVLSSSMGPGWYKEDQLSIMSSALGALPSDAKISPSTLSKIAATLERASGEMTFQRYVRYEKSVFIGELCRLGLYADAVRYFKHQACGSTTQLLCQASEGKLDRVAPLVGMRFPGGSLDEQAAILQLLKNISTKADWRLRWALLEIYQHGDRRHLEDWGKAYGEIIQEILPNPAILEWTRNRICIICQTMPPMRVEDFLRGLLRTLPSSVSETLSSILSNLRDEQFEKHVSAVHLDRRQKAKADKATEHTNQEEKNKLEEDFPLMPGTFGKRSAIDEAKRSFDRAQSHIQRRNFSAAVEEGISTLKSLQNGEWPIWIEEETSSKAHKLISQLVQNADDLARLYGQLILDERYSERWRIADRMIHLASPKLSPTQQQLMLDVAVAHVEDMVGSASPDAFLYFSATESCTASAAVFRLILWALDHPSWERRDCAAEMLLWLFCSSDTWVEEIVRLAVSMTPQNSADIASASLDILSHKDPSSLWNRILPYIDVNIIAQECKHIGRFATFLRVANRASECGIESAIEAVNMLHSAHAKNTPEPFSSEMVPRPKYVPSSLSSMWASLDDLGVLSSHLMQRFESALDRLCSPLKILEMKELEQLLSEGAREPADFHLSRWAYKLRHALHIALFPAVSADYLVKIDNILRVYNPNHFVVPPSGREYISSLVDAILTKREEHYCPANKNLVYLDIQYVFALDDETVHVELTSHIIASGNKKSHPFSQFDFTSTDLPPLEDVGALTTCFRARPKVAYFAGLTPALASSQFLKIIGASQDDTVRYHWRDGVVAQKIAPRRPPEVSLLAIKRDKFSIPQGWGIYWILRINGTIRAKLNHY